MIDANLAELEKGTKALEAEKNFDKALEIFQKNAQLVAQLVKDVDEKKGKITEIIDGVEKNVKNTCD